MRYDYFGRHFYWLCKTAVISDYDSGVIFPSKILYFIIINNAFIRLGAKPPNVDHAHLTTKKQHGHEHQDRPHSPKVVFSRDGTD